jgi:hypothetical protein
LVFVVFSVVQERDDAQDVEVGVLEGVDRVVEADEDVDPAHGQHDDLSDRCRGLPVASQDMKEGACGDEPACGNLPVNGDWGLATNP